LGRKIWEIMVKDLTKPLYEFVKGIYTHRDDLTIQVVNTPKQRKSFYSIHFLIHIRSTDGLYATISKGIDRFFLKKEIQNYFNLGDYDFSITYQNVYPETIY
jgi:hypothetical protein